jgi:chaperonin cofactor prefoldin
MSAKNSFQSKIKSLQNTAQLISFQKGQLELGKKQVEHSIKTLENEMPGDIYLSVGSIYVKYSKEATNSKLENRIKTIDIQLKVLDKRMKQIWGESQKLQEKMRRST